MNENNFMKVEDVAKELGISISHSYKVMQQLNKELKAKGYSPKSQSYRKLMPRKAKNWTIPKSASKSKNLT